MCKLEQQQQQQQQCAYEKAKSIHESNSARQNVDVRTKYLSKLSIQKPVIKESVSSQQKSLPNSQTAIIFDWDDTLLCTSYLTQFGSCEIPSEAVDYLQRIEKVVSLILNTALGLGDTYIITNAVEGWVEESAERYLPGLMSTLRRVRIISARQKQEMCCKSDLKEWKLRAFKELASKYDSKLATNLVSIGDSMFEHEAANALSMSFTQSLVKIIKFNQSPSACELLKELDFLSTKLKPIVGKTESYKFRFSRKQ
jgi:FMN phosphatase YigB (HAD superfamily)